MSEDSLKVITKPPIGGIKRGIALARAQATEQLKELNPQEVQNRIGIVIDDSGSMSGEPMDNAKAGVKNFIVSCDYKSTSIAIYPMNAEHKTLTCNYEIASVYTSTLQATGGTPLYETLMKLIETEKITRAVAFSDGSPNGRLLNNENIESFPYQVVGKYKSSEIPIDTVYIGLKDTQPAKEMEKIAEITGGTFVHFEDSKTLSKSLKYLAPIYRALLANPEIKARIEKGETI